MMSTRAILAVLVMVLLSDVPRSAAQDDRYSAKPITSRSLLSTQATLGPTAQNESQVWNASRYPATDFRSEATPPKFILWPENLSYVRFEHYCEDTTNHTRRLEDFVYRKGQGYLVTRPYYDVGLVEAYKPYFYHWQFWKVDITGLNLAVDCEYTDLQRLYYYRLYRDVLETGLGYGVAAVIIVQAAVIAFIAPLWMYKQWTQQQVPSVSARTFRRSIRHCLGTLKSETPWHDCFCDWVHLLLLVVIGFAMMEGVGHSFRRRSALLFNAAVTYTYLTIFSMSSSFLQQCAHFLTRRSSSTVPPLPTHTAAAAAAAAARQKSGLSEDWRYQRIFGQCGVMVLMGTYLIYVDDDEGQDLDSVGGVVLAAVVVAGIWSAGVSGVVIVRSAVVIFKCLWPKLLAFLNSCIHAGPVKPKPTSASQPAPASQPASPQLASVSSSQVAPQPAPPNRLPNRRRKRRLPKWLLIRLPNRLSNNRH